MKSGVGGGSSAKAILKKGMTSHEKGGSSVMGVTVSMCVRVFYVWPL